MAKIDVDQIRKLRKKTGAPVLRVKQVLEEFKGDEKKALKVLVQEGFEKAAKREGRETKAGLVEAYVHATGNSGAVVVLTSETDFVARNPKFKKLAHEIAMQATAMRPKNIAELLKQPYIRDPKKTVADLIKSAIAKFGENIEVKDCQTFKV